MKEIRSLEETEKLIVINRANLETELEFQPELYMAIADVSARKMSIRDMLKEVKDRVWAEEFLKAKSSSDANGKTPSDKVSETIADASVEYQKATQAYLEAKKDADEWWSKREAFQARTECLKELSRIRGSGLYSSPDVNVKYEDIKKRMREE